MWALLNTSTPPSMVLHLRAKGREALSSKSKSAHQTTVVCSVCPSSFPHPPCPFPPIDEGGTAKIPHSLSGSQAEGGRGGEVSPKYICRFSRYIEQLQDAVFVYLSSICLLKISNIWVLGWGFGGDVRT